MKPYEYTTMRLFEDEYWWYVGLRRLVLAMVKKYVSFGAPTRALDSGCGTGGDLRVLAREFPGSVFVGLEIKATVIELARDRKVAIFVQASANDLPFKDTVFDLVLSLDVLYTMGVNDRKALGELYRVLKPRGILLVNVPAFEFLRGEHDLAVHTRHRYTAHELREILQETGFSVQRVTYWNTVLFPVVLFIRLLRSGRRKAANPRSDLRPLPKVVNGILTWLISVEVGVLSWICSPLGTSVFGVASKSRD